MILWNRQAIACSGPEFGSVIVDVINCDHQCCHIKEFGRVFVRLWKGKTIAKVIGCRSLGYVDWNHVDIFCFTIDCAASCDNATAWIDNKQIVTNTRWNLIRKTSTCNSFPFREFSFYFILIHSERSFNIFIAIAAERKKQKSW